LEAVTIGLGPDAAKPEITGLEHLRTNGTLIGRRPAMPNRARMTFAQGGAG
jgi:hypothetical protein